MELEFVTARRCKSFDQLPRFEASCHVYLLTAQPKKGPRPRPTSKLIRYHLNFIDNNHIKVTI